MQQFYQPDVDGVETTDFGFEGSGEDYAIYLFLNQNFKSLGGIDPIFSEKVHGFGIAKNDEDS